MHKNKSVLKEPRSPDRDLDVFKHEHQMLRKVQGGNASVVQLIAWWPGSKYKIEMQLLRGPDCGKYIARYGPVHSMRHIAELQEAIYFLHERKVVHGDIKPENIVVHNFDCVDERFVIVDFGLAEDIGSVVQSCMFYTEGYRPPELSCCNNVFVKACSSQDVWAMGVTCTELAIGRRIYAAMVECANSTMLLSCIVSLALCKLENHAWHDALAAMLKLMPRARSLMLVSKAVDN